MDPLFLGAFVAMATILVLFSGVRTVSIMCSWIC